MSTAEQWETATVRVEDVQARDEISFGGVWLSVDRVAVRDLITDVIFDGEHGELMLATGTEVEVHRPATISVEAELVEVIARAICLDDGERWDGAIGADAIILSEYRSNAVAALAAARAAGWRIERAS